MTTGTQRPRLSHGRAQRNYLRLIAVACVMGAFGLWLTTLVLESDVTITGVRDSLAGDDMSASDDLLNFDKPIVVSEPMDATPYLPGELKGWRLDGPQPVPSEQDKAVEAYYNPETDERNLVTPLVVYAQVRKVDGAVEARVADWLSRYPNMQATIDIGGVPASIGTSEDGRSMTIVWSEPGILLYVDASFTHFLPPNDSAVILREAVEEVSSAVVAHRRAKGALQ